MYRKTTLPNGLRIVTHDMKERDSVSLGIWIGTGGRYENNQNKGAAHFLEHILFKGSKRYSCDEIKELIEGVGGTLNAFTDEEYTCYYSKIPSKHINKTFDILSDMVINPLVSKKDIDKERTVILEEIKMYHDLPQYFVLELLDTLMWPDHPLGKNLAGTLESVGKMDHNDLRRFHQRYYFPGNIIVAAGGCLKHHMLEDLVKKKLAKIKKEKHSGFLGAQNSQEKTKIKLFPKEIEQMHLALGAFGLEYNHKDRRVFNLLSIILGGNMSSRLFSEVREKRGLAYAISSSVKSLKDAGLFLIRAGVDNQKVAIALDVILKELEKIKKFDVTKKELTQAKDYYLGQILLGLEDTLDHMFWLGQSEISLDRIRTLDEIIKEVQKISVKDIKRVANMIFRENNFNLSVVGPLKGVQEKKLKALMGV